MHRIMLTIGKAIQTQSLSQNIWLQQPLATTFKWKEHDLFYKKLHPHPNTKRESRSLAQIKVIRLKLDYVSERLATFIW